MNQEASSSKKLYRSKVKTQETSKDCIEIYAFVENTKKELKNTFTKSYNRSKVLENLQGLSDMLNKQIKRENNKKCDSARIKKLEQEVESLKEQMRSNQQVFSLSDLDI